MLVIIVIILLIDIYAFKGVRFLCINLSRLRLKSFIYYGFWSITALLILVVVIAFSFSSSERNPEDVKKFLFLAGFFILIYVPKIFFLIFHFFEDIIKLIIYLAKTLSAFRSKKLRSVTEKISKTRLLSKAGLVIAVMLFILIIHGIIWGRFNFQVNQETLVFENLPQSFEDLKIVHISDFHIGSFYGFKDKVVEAIDLINAQNPDLIVFTGDMLNDFAEELEGWIPVLNKMKASYGKFSIMGNHDYGDYYFWETEEAKTENFDKLKSAYKKMDFQLLLNESVSLEKNSEKIAIIGVENWGAPPFAQYGDFIKASEPVKDLPFKILLSHDPSHWDTEIKSKTDVDLTLSGHTHGMQFGFRLGSLKWSPIKLKYPRWDGLYNVGSQFLYVNRGLGYIGFPGRVGMPPEITVIILKKFKSTNSNVN